MKMKRTLSKAMPVALSLATTVALSLMASSALAQTPNEPLQLGIPTYAGSGCPAGSVAAAVSPDNTQLSIMFSSFQVAAGGSTGKSSERKNCNVAIPVHVPHGFSVSMIRIDYRGYQNIPQGANGRFEVEYFLGNQPGPLYTKTFIGRSEGSFLLNNRVTAVSTIWSACGADTNLRTNTAISASTNNLYEQSEVALDSADVSTSIVYQLQWKRCDGGYDPGPVVVPTPYPTPYPTPVPQPQVGACEISSNYDYRGMQYFLVRDGYGYEIGNTYNYQQAQSIAQQAQSRGQCYGIRNLAQQTQPSQQNSCRILVKREVRGLTAYQVLDRYSQVIYQARDLASAQYQMQIDSRCYY